MENENSNKRYCALEISSKSVRLVYGFVYEGLVRILYALETSVDALKDGYVEESDALTATIKNVISSANEALKTKIKEVVLCIPPMGLCFARESTTCTTIGVDNKVVQIDINNCLQQLKKIKFQDSNYKIVDVIPYKYGLDNNEFFNEAPLGKVSTTLTVHASIYGLDSAFVDGYVKAVETANVKVKQVVISPLACALYLPNNERTPTTFYLLNIGAKITTLTLIVNGSLIMQSACFKFGGDKITQAISEKLRISFKDAKMLKEKFGMDVEPSFKCPVYDKYTIKDISTIIHDSIEPLVKAIAKQIHLWSQNDHNIWPLIMTGGGAKLFGLQNLLEESIGGIRVLDFNPYSFGARDKSFQNCLGLISYADKYLNKNDEDVYIKTNIQRVPQNKGKEKGQTSTYRIEEEL